MAKKCGWLSPQGQFFECDEFEHSDAAEDVLEAASIKYGLFDIPDEVLLRLGWVKVGDTYSKQGFVYYKKITQSQYDFMLEYKPDIKIDDQDLE